MTKVQYFIRGILDGEVTFYPVDPEVVSLEEIKSVCEKISSMSLIKLENGKKTTL